jgi:hypothetical protein
MRKKRFAALIPHRDCKKPVLAFQRELFEQGFYGAFSFPLSCPLALISRTLSADELKKIAHVLREKSLAFDGKINAGEWADILLGGVRFGGQKLSIPPLTLEDFPPFTVAELCPIPLLAQCVLSEESPPANPAPLSFRAAFAANITLNPLAADGYSFAWDITGQVWLPPLSRFPKTHLE